MRLLLLILSVMTFTVQTRNTVEAIGEFPYDIEISYSNTYNKGQVRAGDEAVLSLSNLGGISVERIDIAMRSNSSSGSGTLTVHADGQEIVHRKLSHTQLGETLKAITVLDSRTDGVHELVIRITGTQNSLYIDRYTVTYTPAQPHTVTLMNGADTYGVLTEERGMAGVILPVLPNSGDWRFIGWTKTPSYTTATPPACYASGVRYYPDADETLWAAYIYDHEPEHIYLTDLQSGTYLYVNRQTGIALTGVPDETGKMAFSNINTDDASQYYTIEITEGGKALITHTATGTPIGFNGTKMAASASEWDLYHEGSETLFYTTVSSQTYVLWLNVLDKTESVYYAGLIKATVGSGSPMALQLPEEAAEPVYTCYPETPMGMDELSDEKCGTERTVPFGIYEIHIRNRHKSVRLR